MTTTTTTGPLTGGSGSLSVTGAALIAGTTTMPIYAGPVNPGQVGAYITASPDFVGMFTLQRSTTSWQSGGYGGLQTLFTSDGISSEALARARSANVTATDTLTLTATSCTAGSVVLSLVQ